MVGLAPVVVRTLAPVGGRILAGGYLRAYRRRRPVDAALLEQWVVVRAAARLVDEIDDEQEGLERLVADAL